MRIMSHRVFHAAKGEDHGLSAMPLRMTFEACLGIQYKVRGLELTCWWRNCYLHKTTEIRSFRTALPKMGTLLMVSSAKTLHEPERIWPSPSHKSKWCVVGNTHAK